LSGLCSRHWHSEPGCHTCALKAEDVFPDWTQVVAKAEAAGKHECAGCGFVFYLTIDTCPKCYRSATD